MRHNNEMRVMTNEETPIAGYFSNDSDLSRLLARPHKEYELATGLKEYVCSECGAPMKVEEIEHEGKIIEKQTGVRGDQPVFGQHLELIIYASHRCTSTNDCLGVELAYDL